MASSRNNKISSLLNMKISTRHRQDLNPRPSRRETNDINTTTRTKPGSLKMVDLSDADSKISEISSESSLIELPRVEGYSLVGMLHIFKNTNKGFGKTRGIDMRKMATTQEDLVSAQQMLLQKSRSGEGLELRSLRSRKALRVSRLLHIFFGTSTSSSQSQSNETEETQELARQMRSVTLDDILIELGHFGRFQRRLLLIMMLVGWSVGFLIMGPTFTLSVPDYRCKLPSDLYKNDTYEIQSPAHKRAINDAIPVRKDKTMTRCHIYRTVISENSTTRLKEKCKEWVFSKHFFDRTIVTDLSLFCERYKNKLKSKTLVHLGEFVGSIVAGLGQDIYGRRPVLIVSCIGMLVLSVTNCFISSVLSLLINRFLIGFTTLAAFVSIYVLAMEYTIPQDRRLIGFASRLSFVVGQLSLVPLVYLQHDWQRLQLTFLWPSIILVMLMWTVPESALWLMARNKNKLAYNQIMELARVNQVPCATSVEFSDQIENIPTTRFKASPFKLFYDKKLLWRWITVYVSWFIIALIYYKITRKMARGDNFIVNYLQIVLVDLAAIIFTDVSLSKSSTRSVFLLAMIVAGGSGILGTMEYYFFEEDLKFYYIVMHFLTKMGASSSFFIVYMYTSLMFPTPHRGFGIGSGSMFARVGGILYFYIPELDESIEGSIEFVLGAICLTAGLLALSWPEVRQNTFPENIADCQNQSRSGISDECLVEKQ